MQCSGEHICFHAAILQRRLLASLSSVGRYFPFPGASRSPGLHRWTPQAARCEFIEGAWERFKSIVPLDLGGPEGSSCLRPRVAVSEDSYKNSNTDTEMILLHLKVHGLKVASLLVWDGKILCVDCPSLAHRLPYQIYQTIYWWNTVHVHSIT